MMKKIVTIAVVIALASMTAFAMIACGEEEETTTTEAMTETTAGTETTEAAEELKDIVDTAVAAGDFSTLASLLTAAGLVDTLKGEGPFTVFAPTDEAFAAVPQATLDALGADPTGALTSVLTYHVIPGKVMAADVTDGLEAATVQGATVKFTVQDGKVMINGATVIMTDIVCSNGVIHVIDAVILPPES